MGQTEKDMSREQEACPAGSRIGLIAGNGRFPLLFAENATRLGYKVSAVAHVGETDQELEKYVDHIHWVKIGQFNKLIQALKDDGVQHAVMLGGIKKTHMFSNVFPDFRALAIASRLRHLKDDAILREVALELEKEGIQIRESTFGLTDILVQEGTLTKREPNKREWEDIYYGWEVVKDIGRLDIGQCVLVKDRVIVSVEAVEGTDETIRRGGQLAREGAVVVKRSKPHQDLRFDLPAVGPTTIETMKSVKASVLALEAGRGVFLERQETVRLADQAGLAIVGLTSNSSQQG